MFQFLLVDIQFIIGFSQESAPLPRPEFKRGGARWQYGGLLFSKIPGSHPIHTVLKSNYQNITNNSIVLISGSGGLHGPDGSGAEPSRGGSCWTHQDRLCRLVVSLIIIILVMMIIMILIWGVWWCHSWWFMVMCAISLVVMIKMTAFQVCEAVSVSLLRGLGPLHLSRETAGSIQDPG